MHRTDGSGTTFIFTNYLATQSETFKAKIGAAKQVDFAGGSGGKGNEGVTQAVQSTKGAIGYVELAYAQQNKLHFALVKNHEGEFIKASPDGASLAAESAVKTMDKNLAAPLWNQPGKGAYPIAGFVYVMLYKDLSFLQDPSKAKALAAFLSWATHDGQKLATELDYAPLSAGVQEKVSNALKELSVSGSPVPQAAAQ